MTYFYSDTKLPGAKKIDVWKMDGTKAYLRHYDNLLFLDFVAKSPRSKDAEKRQARLELTICEKKLTYWQRHPNYDHELALKGIVVLKKHWSAK